MKNEGSSVRPISTQKVESAKIETPSTTDTIEIAVIEDDENFRQALVFQLVTAGFHVDDYLSAESFMESFRSERYDCIVADICLPGMNGLQFFAKIKRSVPFVSIVFVTGSGDMSIGVQAMRDGAIDCMEKPIDDGALLNSIKRATDLYRSKRAEALHRLGLRQREGTLTPREREVFGLITSGLLNKQVGATLGATERTIKTHRGRVMDKMSADSLADLVRMAEILQIQPISRCARTNPGQTRIAKPPDS